MKIRINLLIDIAKKLTICETFWKPQVWSKRWKIDLVRILTVLIDNVDDFCLEHLRRKPADIKEDSVFSDETEIKGDKWEVLKHKAMKPNFKQTS